MYGETLRTVMLCVKSIRANRVKVCVKSLDNLDLFS